MVLQQDAAWDAQNGPPRDSQAGNSKGKVDVNRTAGVQPIFQTASTVTTESPALLGEAELAAMTEQVKALWRSVPGITDAMLARLDAINVAVGNLEGAELGMCSATRSSSMPTPPASAGSSTRRLARRASSRSRSGAAS